MKHLENPIVLWTLIIFLVVVIFMTREKKEPTPVSPEIETLEIENENLKENIRIRTEVIISQKKTIDSLENLKPKIKIRYEKIYENINLMPVDNLLIEFDSIFTKEGITSKR